MVKAGYSPLWDLRGLRSGQQEHKYSRRSGKGGAHFSRVESGRKGGLTHMRNLLLHPSSTGLWLCRGGNRGEGAVSVFALGRKLGCVVGWL